jgi:hypothetical protein
MGQKIISVHGFKSTSASGNKAKTYVIGHDDGVIFIIQRVLATEILGDYKVIKKFKGKYLLERYIGFKLNSYNTIVNIIENDIKPLLKPEDIIS